MPFRTPECLFRGVVCPGDFEVLGEQPDLFGFVLEPLGERVAGMVALGPVTVPVGGHAPLDGLVVAFPQVGEELYTWQRRPSLVRTGRRVDLQRFDGGPLQTLLDSPVLAILPFGYPARAAGRGKKNRKPLAEVASAERYGQPLG